MWHLVSRVRVDLAGKHWQSSVSIWKCTWSIPRINRKAIVSGSYSPLPSHRVIWKSLEQLMISSNNCTVRRFLSAFLPFKMLACNKSLLLGTSSFPKIVPRWMSGDVFEGSQNRSILIIDSLVIETLTEWQAYIKHRLFIDQVNSHGEVMIALNSQGEGSSYSYLLSLSFMRDL